MNEIHKWLLKKARAMPDFYYRNQSCSNLSLRRSLEICPESCSWVCPWRGFLTVLPPPGDGLSSVPLRPRKTHQASPGTGSVLTWRREGSLVTFCFTVQLSAYHSANYDCPLGNGDVCPVETSWDHIWILKRRCFLLCEVRPSSLLALCRPETLNSISTPPCAPASTEPLGPDPSCSCPGPDVSAQDIKKDSCSGLSQDQVNHPLGGARRPCSLQSSQPILSSLAENLACQVVLGAVLSLTSPLIISASSGALVCTAPTFLPKCFLVIMVDLPATLNNPGAVCCLCPSKNGSKNLASCKFMIPNT